MNNALHKLLRGCIVRYRPLFTLPLLPWAVSMALADTAILETQPRYFDYQDLDGPWQEQAFRLPAAPDPEALLAFDVGPTSRNRFYIDPASLSSDRDGVVRYVVVVRSPQGVDNVFFEGQRCANGNYRRYAYHSGGEWQRTTGDDWREAPVGPNAWQRALTPHFCRHGLTVKAEHILQTLRHGPPTTGW